MMRGREPQGIAVVAAIPTETNDSQRRKAKFNTTGNRCVLHRGLPCCGQQQYNSASERLTCSSCAPAGVSLTRLTQQQQESILLGALYV